jgi:hypothetical protein
MTSQNDSQTTVPPERHPIGELISGGSRFTLRGCALQLAIWIARHQGRINDTAPDGGQLLLHWKGIHPPSIVAEIRTRL